MRATSPDDVAVMLAYARRVVIVPGYGLAVAQAQHNVRELADQLERRGVDVRYAIHPVAGRMPGHMNVLLAEADVPYTQLYEMDDINDEFPRTDVSLVIGANDVVNPAANNTPGSPIYGMPVLNVDRSAAVVVLKRSMNTGFAGIENELFYDPKTTMLFGDAKESIMNLDQRGQGGMSAQAARGERLRRLHDDEALLVMVNVWDAVTARLVAELPGCRALATASHSIAEAARLPRRRADPARPDDRRRRRGSQQRSSCRSAPTSRPGTATSARRCGARSRVGAVGANIEDQMRPLPEAAAMMAAAVAAAEGEGVPFALNARTDAYLRGGDRDRGELLEDAVARGRAFLDAGATCVFVPGRLEVAEIEALVAGIGRAEAERAGRARLPGAARSWRRWAWPASRSAPGRSGWR